MAFNRGVVGSTPGSEPTQYDVSHVLSNLDEQPSSGKLLVQLLAQNPPNMLLVTFCLILMNSLQGGVVGSTPGSEPTQYDVSHVFSNLIFLISI